MKTVTIPYDELRQLEQKAQKNVDKYFENWAFKTNVVMMMIGMLMGAIIVIIMG